MKGGKGDDRADHEPCGDLRHMRGRDGERGEADQHGRQRRQIDAARPRGRRQDDGAKQARRRDFARLGEWPQGKSQRDQEAEQAGQRERPGIEAGARGDGQAVGQQRRDDIGRQRAQQKPDRNRARRENQDLEQVDAEDQGARPAQAFERGDRGDPRFQVAAHRVADADTADQQRGQADKAEKQGRAIDEALNVGGGVLDRLDPPARVRKPCLDAVAPGGKRDALRDGDAIVVAHQAARQQQARGAQRRKAYQQARAEIQDAGPAIHLFGDDGGDPDGDIAEA